ncbi:dephospho-CoA kinase [Chitinimonas prasina]|uniref:Dephospho-CoA kinase n=1 Tax=Chitinimonas prasina TaxID=1434937 RepID=A0ABQ5YJH3_9NEIS|nr:dephospho-CoA kinase [Chitinimonas prasina]
MRVIGLTGGIGSGKSAVAQAFQALGVPLVDTDEIAHRLSQPGQAGAACVAQLFGSDYLTPDGAIDRPRLRHAIFSNPQAKANLEATFHPLIRQTALADLASLPTTTPYCLLAVPLLFETGAYASTISRALVVDVPEAMQISRVMQRSQLSETEVRAIMAGQMSRSERLARADDVITNDGDLAQLADKVKVLHKKYLQAPESEPDSA